MDVMVDFRGEASCYQLTCEISSPHPDLTDKPMAQHRRANATGQDSAVYLHLKEKGHSFNDNNVHILDREDTVGGLFHWVCFGGAGHRMLTHLPGRDYFTKFMTSI